MMSASRRWREHALGELAIYLNGRAFKSTEWSAAGLPIVRIQNLTDPSRPFNYFDSSLKSQHRVDDGDLLLSWSATLGSFIWDRGPAALNQHIFKVVPNEDLIDREFLHYLLANTLEEMSTHAHGLAMKHITKSKFEALRVRVPALQEQRRLVGRIKECMERVSQISELRASALAEAERLSPSFYSAIEEAGSWPRKMIGDLISGSRNGKSIRQDNVNGDGHVLSLSAVRDVSLDLEQRKPIVLPKEIARKFAIAAGDVFVSRANTIGLVGLASVAVVTSPAPLIYPDLLIRLTPKSDAVRPRFLAYALRTPESRRQIRARALGSSQSMVKISGQRLKEVEVPVPPLSEQDKLIERFDYLHDLSSELTTNLRSAECEQLREAVLRHAFAGEL